MNIFPKHWGKYPAEYNREVHGFYDPAVYYGKPDTPLAEVKLGDLGAWLRRRNKSFHAITSCVSRAFWRHQQTWIGPKRPGIAGALHYAVAIYLFYYIVDYPKYQVHQNYRYH